MFSDLYMYIYAKSGSRHICSSPVKCNCWSDIPGQRAADLLLAHLHCLDECLSRFVFEFTLSCWQSLIIWPETNFLSWKSIPAKMSGEPEMAFLQEKKNRAQDKWRLKRYIWVLLFFLFLFFFWFGLAVWWWYWRSFTWKESYSVKDITFRASNEFKCLTIIQIKSCFLGNWSEDFLPELNRFIIMCFN